MHLYLHVPFCARRCVYCDFAIAVRRRVPDRRFVDAVLREWDDRARPPAAWTGTAPFETIYFGGGTPSHLQPASIAAILDRLRPAAHPDAEITLETNPEDVSAERAAAWRRAGVTRISLGVQSFDPAVLAWMHRVHTADRPLAAVPLLRAAGFRNISLDLIYGLPAALTRDWRADLDQALALEPDHLSLYGLTVEPRTPLRRWVERGAAVPLSDDRAADEYLEAHDAVTRAGMTHYEVSNAARPGFESRHNLGYWRRAPYLGLGPSAHSAAAGRRWWNRREWADYEARIAAGDSPVEGEERLTADQIRLEALYLGLRTAEGVPSESIPAGTAATWTAAGWARRAADRVVLGAEGWLRLDRLAAAIG